jgi:ketosteroid isomerase-like protein
MPRGALTDAGSATPDLLVDLARRAGEAFNTRDVAALAALIHEDCEFHSAFGAIEGRIYRGPAETAAYVEDIDLMFDDWHLESEEFHPAPGGRIVSTYRAIGRAKESGIPVDFALALLWEARDGKLIRGEVHMDQAEALRKAGLEELAETWQRTDRGSGRRFGG